MNRAQRIVLVIALGVVVIAVAATVNLVADRRMGGGWFAYAPNTGVIFDDQYSIVAAERVLWRRAGVWIAAAVLWGLTSLMLLRDRAKEPE